MAELADQGAMAALRPHAQVHLLSPIDKCKVCNEPAAKHVHYGAMSCFSCRAFFRRSIQNNTYGSYQCRRAHDCTISLKTRRNCQWCRYERCLAVGMKPSWVLSTDERERRFKKNRDKNELRGRGKGGKAAPAGSPPPGSPGVSPPCSPPLTSQQQQQQQQKQQQQLKPQQQLQPQLQPQLQQQQWGGVTVKTDLFPLHLRPSHGAQPLQQVAPIQLVKGAVQLTGSGGVQLKGPGGLQIQSPGGGQVQSTRTVEVVRNPCRTGGVQIHGPGNGGVQIHGPGGVQIQGHEGVQIQGPGGVQIQGHGGVQIQGHGGVQIQGHQSVQIHNHGVVQLLSPAEIQLQGPRGVQLQGPRAPHTGVIVRQYRPPLAPASLTLAPSTSLTWRQETVEAPRPQDMARYQEGHTPQEARARYQEGHTPQEAGAGGGRFCQTQAAVLLPLPEALAYSMEVAPYHNRGGQDESDYEESVYSNSSEEGAAALFTEPEIKFTSEELGTLQQLVQQHDRQYKSVNFGETLIKEMIMCSMFGIPVSMSAAISGYRLTVERITRIANNLDCFGDLSKFEQNSLLKENADLLVSMRGAIFFDSRKKGVNQVLISMGIDDMDTIKTMFTPLMKEDRMKHIDYKTFNSIQQVNSSEIEQRYNFLQSKVAEAVGDEIIVTLLTYIILFSMDFCPIQDRRRIEQVQERFIRMMERYIYSKFPRTEACHTFATCLNAVTCIREMADIKKRRSMNMNRAPVLAEAVSSQD